MNASEKEKIKTIIENKITIAKQEIDDLKKLSSNTPISPDSSLGRMTRMDSMHSKDVHEKMLSKYNKDLAGLQEAYDRLDDSSFGLCSTCNKPIPFTRLEIMPASKQCIDCAQKVLK